jgi:hypothetical protein
MSKEDLDERREELIRDERVRQMIRVRAYEIYQMRGPQPGGQAQDWFQAENEVLSFLIADESRQIENESRKVEIEPSTASTTVAAAPAKATATKKSSSRIASAAKTTSKKRTTKKPPDTEPKPARKRSTPKEPE